MFITVCLVNLKRSFLSHTLSGTLTNFVQTFNTYDIPISRKEITESDIDTIISLLKIVNDKKGFTDRFRLP